MADSGRESFGDAASSSRELERLRRHLKLAHQHLDLAYQAEEGSPSRSSSPEVHTPAQTAAEQNRLNFAQEKQGEASEKGNGGGGVRTQMKVNRLTRMSSSPSLFGVAQTNEISLAAEQQNINHHLLIVHKPNFPQS